ncbi:MAG: hypothetical protein GX060_07365 [Firmicutes bacterium]|nr:hypothetical protein [Bacillota bacterium]
MQQNLKDVVDRIVAIVPIYGDGGDATLLILDDGQEVIHPKTIASCLKQIWRIYSFDWKAYRREYRTLLNQRNLLPWPADFYRMFAPLKLRQPLISGDAAYGYVAIEAVEEVGQNEPTQAAKSFVSLRCGHRLAVYLEPREVHKHLQAAAYAAQQFWGQRLKRDPYMLMMRASERY